MTKSVSGPRSSSRSSRSTPPPTPRSWTRNGASEFPACDGSTSTAMPGPGHHISKTRGDLVEGSPLIALNTNPPFHEYHFIDSDTGRAAELRKEAGDRPDVFTYSEDCNTVLLSKVFPRAKYAEYKRALCLLDPYNIDLTWEVIETSRQSAVRRDFHELHDHGHQPQRTAKEPRQVHSTARSPR